MTLAISRSRDLVGCLTLFFSWVNLDAMRKSRLKYSLGNRSVYVTSRFFCVDMHMKSFQVPRGGIINQSESIILFNLFFFHFSF